MDYIANTKLEDLPAIVDFVDVPTLKQKIFEQGLEPYIFVNLKKRPITLYADSYQRMIQVAQDCDATITFSYFRDVEADGTRRDHPLNDYQFGSVRDDFDFGSLVLLNTTDVLVATEGIEAENFNSEDYPDGGWYALRLRMAISRPVCCLQEYLYETPREDYRDSGARQHDYVDTRRRSYQKAMEETFVEFLREIGGDVDPTNIQTLPLDSPEYGPFPIEASVIIPVRNRCRTITDAVKSALSQKTTFPFNVIVVDNASTDGTTLQLSRIEDPRLHVIHVRPEEGLGIGGCWNAAVSSPACGRFAVQLDSDDVYSGEDTLQKIVDCFWATGAAMVVGSYTLTDMGLNPIGNGVIDHREWTEEQGRDNALRINGFGAPRAFFTPVIRQIRFPNVSYGEDYAACLRISREYKVGRIFESLYNCRRWEGNSDANLTIEKENEHNSYKDFVRTLELLSRIKMNNQEEEEQS